MVRSGLIAAPGGEGPTIGAERHAVDRIPAEEKLSKRLVVCQVPKDDQAIFGSRGEIRLVRAVHHPVDPGLVPAQVSTVRSARDGAGTRASAAITTSRFMLAV